jgi:hypothetical protein
MCDGRYRFPNKDQVTFRQWSHWFNVANYMLQAIIPGLATKPLCAIRRFGCIWRGAQVFETAFVVRCQIFFVYWELKASVRSVVRWHMRAAKVLCEEVLLAKFL